MVLEELDICREHAPELIVVLLHESEQHVLFLNLQVVCVFQSRGLLCLRIDLHFTGNCAALQVKNALDGIGVSELEGV